jgi:hypothetical protein
VMCSARSARSRSRCTARPGVRRRSWRRRERTRALTRPLPSAGFLGPGDEHRRGDSAFRLAPVTSRQCMTFHAVWGRVMFGPVGVAGQHLPGACVRRNRHGAVALSRRSRGAPPCAPPGLDWRQGGSGVGVVLLVAAPA